MLLIWPIITLAGIVSAATQQPLSVPESDAFRFQPIHKVAVIGAGQSGLVAYRELTEAGLDVRIFERDSVPGGIWRYTDDIPLDAPVPNAPCAVADFAPSMPPASVELPYSEVFEDSDRGELWRDHWRPRPIWAGLKLNTPWFAQQYSHWSWPADTAWELSQYQIRNYIRSYASFSNINSNDGNPAAAYNTRVEHIEKRVNHAGQEQGWRLWLKSLESTAPHAYNATWWTEDFDAVVVAVGRFNAPSMPSIPGLEAWVQRFPGLVRHSRQYRWPEDYANQTVLIIGASTSGSQISISLNRHARQVYQSFRPDADPRRHYRLENFIRQIPKNTTFIGEVTRFLPIAEGSAIQSGLVELKNGTILSGFDSVILATGFRYAYPFLPQYYDGATYVPHPGSAKTVSPFLPLDGSHVRDLYLDLFYIQDPTLALMGVTSGTQSFIQAEYMAIALAKVWTNTAKLPDAQTMRARYDKTVAERGGYGKHLLFLGPSRFEPTIRALVGWLNEAAVKYGGKQVDGLPKQYAEMGRYWLFGLFGGPLEETLPEEDKEVRASLGLEPVGGADGKSEYHLIYDDNW